MSAHSLAHELKAYAHGSIAWNMPPALEAHLIRKTVNQFGTSYRFDDNSLAFVSKGQTQVSAQAE